MLAAWTIVETLVFSGMSMVWLTFGTAAAIVAVAAAGLIVHDLSTERVVHSLEDVRTHDRFMEGARLRDARGLLAAVLRRVAVPVARKGAAARRYDRWVLVPAAASAPERVAGSRTTDQQGRSGTRGATS